MPEDHEFFENKHPDRIYITRSFPSFSSEDDEQLRFISKVFDEQELHEFIDNKGEIVLRVTPGERQEVRAMFYEDSREIKSLTFQRFTKRTNKPHKETHFTFSGDSLEKIYKLLRVIKYLRLEQEEKVRLDDELLDELLISIDEKEKFLLKNPELVQDIVENKLTKSDVVALAYRKKQLEMFDKLLSDEIYFEIIKNEWEKRGPEAVWQQYFENNPWIFGYGLHYIYLSKLDDKKLEQVVAGFSISQGGKRVDGLMKTRGLISSLCFIEIKTHKTNLLHNAKAYRSESWRISDELGGSISQIQKTVQKAVKDIQTKIEFETDFGEPTGETAFLYQPKSFVVVGSLNEFMTENGINEQKFSSFELFRRNITSPEIITFDELFERAKYIVQYSEKVDAVEIDENDQDDIPF